MSAGSTGIPQLIEQQLLSLDKQLRDAAFVRGTGRMMVGVVLLSGFSFLLDGWLDLNGTIRSGLLIGWVTGSFLLSWRYLIQPVVQPVSFPSLAALVEKQFPELRERLTSLVELRGDEQSDLAPGASKLMQDILARQTVKAFDRLTLDHVTPTHDSFKSLFIGALAVVLLLAPFGWNADGYGLLWSRLFAPWGNFAWGSSIEVKVLEGDQVVARGSDVPVHVSLIERRHRRAADTDHTAPVWLNWVDSKGISDVRKLDWDEHTEQYATYLPHIMQSLTFQVMTRGAKSGSYRVDVSDPPAISQLKLDIEPAAYTGLPAKSMTGVPSEIRVAEFSRVELSVEFDAPVASAELKWPGEAEPAVPGRRTETPVVELSIPFVLSDDRRSGTAKVVATHTGSFNVLARNSFGLQNTDPARTLVVIPDQPPRISLDGIDDPVLVRPDDLIEILVEVHDDFGLTAVELHSETSTGIKQVATVPAAELRDPHLKHEFELDLEPLKLTSGQIVTYRIRAVDNRPQPNPQEVWTTSRTLMINTSLKQLPDQAMAREEKSLEDALTNVREDLNDAKEKLAALHQQTEEEALNKRPESDKTKQLNELIQAQKDAIDQLERLSDRLAERRMTQDLAPRTQEISEIELKAAQDRLEQSKGQPARDQLQPIAQAIDQLGNADRQLRKLEQQLGELNKMEQDLAELSRIAQRADRVADQLEKLEKKDAATVEQKSDPNMAIEKTQESPQSNAESTAAKNKESASPTPVDNASPSKGNTTAAADATAPDKTTPNPADAKDPAVPQSLKDDAQKLTDQLNELVKKHPELLDAARRDQLDQLNQLADQARKLAGPQEQIAEALKQAANNAPTSASRPDNLQSPETPGSQKPGEETRSTPAKEIEASPPKTPDGQAANNQPKDASPQKEPGPANEKASDTSSKPANPAPDSTPTQKPNDQPAAQNPQQQQGSAAAQKQEQIAREATQQALDLARDTGADSVPTKSASEFARAADAAKQQAQSGQLKTAAEQAQKAAQAAQETARQLNPDGQSSSPQSARAEQLASQQRESAEQLKKLAPSPEASQGAQLQGQRQLAEATNQLSKQLERAADALKSNPLNAPAEAETANQAKSAAQQAEQAMKQSVQANQQNDSQKSAESATNALESLKQVATSIKPSSNPKPSSPPVPKEIGTQLAEAMKQLDAAQKDLLQSNNPKQSEASPKANPKSEQPPSNQPSSPAEKPQSQNPSTANEDKNKPKPPPGNQPQDNKPAPETPSASQSPPQSKSDQSPSSKPAPKSQSTSEGPPQSKPGQSPSPTPGQSPSSQPGQSPSSQPGQSPSPKPSQPGNPNENSSSNQPPGSAPGQKSPSGSPLATNASNDNSSAKTETSQTQTPGKPGNNQSVTKANTNSNTNNSPTEKSQLVQTAEQFRKAAVMLRQARGEPNEAPLMAQSKAARSSDQSPPGEKSEQSKPGESGASASGSEEVPDVAKLDAELQQQLRQNWGRLPGRLRTEILQGSGKKSHPEYRQRIKSYFDEITKPAK